MSLKNDLDEKTSTCVEHEEKVNDMDILLKQETKDRKELEMQV